MARHGIAFFALFVILAFGLPRMARADVPGAHTVPVAVLAFDSEDAEEQADAMTGALRSRVRASHGWSLIETTQSLAMLTAAMKCPSRPPPECQQRIAEQIKAERFLWGFATKGPIQGQVSMEIHLYQKGKPDTVLKESHADNLKDPNEDTLRKIAARIIERFSGDTLGVVVVRAIQTGDVVVDGEKHVPLVKGTARIEVAAGGHSIEVTEASGSIIKKNVLVTVGRETLVEFGPTPKVEPPSQASRPLQIRKIIGGAAMGVGFVFGAVAVQQAIHYTTDLQDRVEAIEARMKQVDDKRECKEFDQRCKDLDDKLVTASVLTWTFGAASVIALGVGAYLFFTDSGPSEQTRPSASPKPKAHLVPSVSTDSGGLVVVGTF